MANDEVVQHARSDNDLVRRVQRTGLASLTVTLPKSWTEAMGVVHGDSLRFRDLGGGRLEVSALASSAMSDEHESPPKTLSVDARDAPPHLLARLIVGAYITGHDRVVLSGRVTPAQRQEVTRTVARLLGASIVEDGPDRIEVQNFVDPTHYALPRLMGRIAGLLRLQLEGVLSALNGREGNDLDRLAALEDEVDKLYRLMSRQLLLAADNFQIAREIGVPSHHFQLGYRVVAKVLEEEGDQLNDLGREIAASAQSGWEVPANILSELAVWVERFERALDRTMTAFAHASALEANESLNEIQEDLPILAQVGISLPRRIRDKASALTAQRLITGISQAMRRLVIVNEITINRSVEPEALTGPGDRILRFAATYPTKEAAARVPHEGPSPDLEEPPAEDGP